MQSSWLRRMLYPAVFIWCDVEMDNAYFGIQVNVKRDCFDVCYFMPPAQIFPGEAWQGGSGGASGVKSCSGSGGGSLGRVRAGGSSNVSR